MQSGRHADIAFNEAKEKAIKSNFLRASGLAPGDSSLTSVLQLDNNQARQRAGRRAKAVRKGEVQRSIAQKRRRRRLTSAGGGGGGA